MRGPPEGAGIVRATHQEEWRDWPVEAPATPPHMGTVPNPAGTGQAWEMWKSIHPDLCPSTGGGFFVSDDCLRAEMQGMRRGLSARCTLRLRELLRAARGLL